MLNYNNYETFENQFIEVLGA